MFFFFPHHSLLSLPSSLRFFPDVPTFPDFLTPQQPRCCFHRRCWFLVIIDIIGLEASKDTGYLCCLWLAQPYDKALPCPSMNPRALTNDHDRLQHPYTYLSVHLIPSLHG